MAVVDGSRPVNEEDREVLRLASSSGKPWIFVQSKGDLAQAPLSLPEGAGAATVLVSARTGAGLDALGEQVAALFPVGEGSGALLTDDRQEDAARRARAAVRRAEAALAEGMTPDAVLTDAEEALDALGELTGRTAREEIVERIFSRFCVGK